MFSVMGQLMLKLCRVCIMELKQEASVFGYMIQGACEYLYFIAFTWQV